MTTIKGRQTPVGKDDDTRRPVWLEATESFYKKLNRIAKECGLSRYEASAGGSMRCFEKHRCETLP
jgi:hypothetical protein